MAQTANVYSDADLNLPLLGSELVCIVAPSPHRSLIQIETEPQPLFPARPLEAGEQYRFHFDMTKCIGCKCCVVACNEQNGNPAAINWRRVGEVEGGHYPNTQRYPPFDGLQSLPGAVLPDRLPGGGVHQGSGHRRGDSQRRGLHRLPVLHLELFLRRAAIQSGARRGGQVRYVPQPNRATAWLRRALPRARRARSRSRS